MPATMSIDRTTVSPRSQLKLDRHRRRALTLLAGSPHGATEATMVAHGFSIAFRVELVASGLATAHSQQMRAGKKPIA
jgi:hypothetical protein